MMNMRYVSLYNCLINKAFIITMVLLNYASKEQTVANLLLPFKHSL